MDENLSSKRYEPKFIDLSNKNSSQTAIIDLTGYNKKVLEIGTSTGYITKILQEHQNEIVGIEIDPEAAQLAEKYCLRMIIGDIEKIDLDNILDSTSFDVIIFGDVLEHLKNPSGIIKKIKKFLLPNGYLVVSLPNFCHGDVIINILYGDFHYTDIGLLDKTHLHFFGLKNIYPLFSDAGYQISDLSSTHQEMGKTEQNIYSEKIPPQLYRFIKSLPETNTYQFIFTAYPSEKHGFTQLEERDIGCKFFEALEESAKHVNELERKNAELTNHSRHLEAIVSDRDHQVQSLQQENEALRRSITHKVTTKLHRTVVERLFPPATGRRRFYDLGLDGGRILINEGGSKFWERVHAKFSLGWEIDPIKNYQLWIKKNESEYRDTNVIKKEVKLLQHLPKISIVVPVWDVDIKWLKLMIESVLSQVYENWELCIVDADSKNTSIKEILTHYQNKNSRIKVKFLNENLGISGNTNEAMDMATGEFVGFLDHDDELAPFALYEVVKYINNHHGVKLVYSDEDKITNTGIRLDPFFKPDWAPDQFLSQNYLCHFCVIEKEILARTGKLRKEFDGSQDYDLLLRLTEILDKKNIGHIRKILYHWRVVTTSTSSSINAKPYVIANSKRAINESLIRRKLAAEVCDGILPDTYRVKYLIQGKPLVSIIIPTKDNSDYLYKCIQSILNKTAYDNYEIVIVNNNSKMAETYRLFDDLKRDGRIKIIDYPEKFNFSLINNFAVGHTSGEFIVFLNNDTEVIADEWLTAMLEHAQRKEVGSVGAKLVYSDNTIQHAGVILGIGARKSAVAGHPHKYFNADSPGYFSSLNIIRNFSAVTAACMMMRKDVFLEVGGFDKNLEIAFNDVELCIKIRDAGYFIVYTPFALLFHYESKSRGYDDSPEKNKRFNSEIQYIRSKWGNVIDRGDPFYNSNLTHLKEDFSLNT